MAKTFSQVIGVVLLVVGILGFVVGGEKMFLGLIMFSTTHNIVHLLSGAILAYLGFMGSESSQRTGAQVFGVIYGLVTLLGLFIGADAAGKTLGLELHLNPTYNVIHLVIAAFGLYAGFAKKPATATAH